MMPWRTWAMNTLFLVAAVVASIVYLRASLDARVMIEVTAGLGFRLLLCVVGPMRRCSGHWLVQYGAMAAYYLPSLLVPRIITAAWYSGGNINMYHVLWCVLLLLNSSEGAVEMTAYARSDNPHQRRFPALQYMLSLCWLIWSLYGTDGGLIILTPLSLVACVLVLIFCVLTLPVGKSAEDRMREDRRRQNEGENRDVCLSYSYCRHLTWLHYGIPEDGSALTELQSAIIWSPQGYKRAFTIVDMQLAFLHDYFFTSYHSMIRYPPRMLSVADEMLKVLENIALMIAGAIFLGICGLPYFGFGVFELIFFSGFGVYQIFSVAVVIPIDIMIDWTKRRPIVPKYWRTFLETGTVYRPTVIEQFVERCQSVNCLDQPYWQNKIGQYSIIKDYDRRYLIKVCLAWFKRHLLPEVPVFKYHLKEEHPADLPESLKESVAKEVVNVAGRLASGRRSLERNNVWDKFSWTLDQATHTHTILIWHIATWYCDNFSAGGRGRDGEVATLLSGYCAYLVAFHPELLPGQRKTTTRVLRDVLLQAETKMSSDKGLQLILQKARALLGMPRTMPEKQEMLKKVSRRMDDEDVLTTFEKGMKLGRDLVERDTPDARSSNHKESWTVMAEFWVETILYVAPSRNAAAHVDRLAQGGEFVTHLWAFLSDVGVVEREGHRPYQSDA